MQHYVIRLLTHTPPLPAPSPTSSLLLHTLNQHYAENYQLNRILDPATYFRPRKHTRARPLLYPCITEYRVSYNPGRRQST